MTVPKNRMVVAALSLVGAFVATYLLLYKLGFVGSLACGAGASCQTVQTSPWAYFIGLPVAGWGVAGYLAIFGAAFLGAQPRFADARWVPISLLTLTGGAFAFSVYLTALEAFVIHAWCWWCVASAVIATATFGFAIPEARELRA